MCIDSMHVFFYTLNTESFLDMIYLKVLFQSWKNIFDEPVCKQKVQQSVQSHNRGRFSHQRSYGR